MVKKFNFKKPEKRKRTFSAYSPIQEDKIQEGISKHQAKIDYYNTIKEYLNEVSR